MEYIEGSKGTTGYDVSVTRRDSFHIRGYTLVAPPGKRGEVEIARLWDQLISEGKLAKLVSASATPPNVLGLGSWDPECPKGGQRFTVCIEETAGTDFTAFGPGEQLFSKVIGASEWLCFEVILGDQYPKRFWRDDPYKMMGPLGYRFHTAPDDYSVGLHFEVYPPGFSFGSGTNKDMQFWISVLRSSPEGSAPRGG
jgi:hypothetical protein